MRILHNVIEKTRDLLQLLEGIAEEQQHQQIVEKESPQWPPQCIHCSALLVGCRVTSIADSLCDRCWDNYHPMYPEVLDSVRLHNI